MGLDILAHHMRSVRMPAPERESPTDIITRLHEVEARPAAKQKLVKGSTSGRGTKDQVATSKSAPVLPQQTVDGAFSFSRPIDLTLKAQRPVITKARKKNVKLPFVDSGAESGAIKPLTADDDAAKA